jgi:hypothetical protein
VELEITPEPSPEEREALARALASLEDSGPAERRSAWGRAGIEESISPEEEPV